MTYEDFEKFVREKCMYETIYDDSEGRRILVIRLLDAYSMMNKKEWVGLTDEERYCNDGRSEQEIEYAKAIEAKLKEKNNG